MQTHDFLDGLASLVCVVEWNRADVVVQDVRFDDPVEDVASDEAKVTVDRGCCSSSEVPYLGFVVR